MNLSRSALLFAAATGLAGAATITSLPAPAHAAAATITSTVECTNGRNVVGVWVESTGGGSTWASWKAFPGTPSVAAISATVNVPGQVRLHVGCGGTPQSWYSNNRTPYISVSGSRVLNTRCAEAAGTATRCSFPATGKTASRNTFYAGYCTWGAAEKWKQAVGSYPGWNGDAWQWANNAAAAGWTVRSAPSARAVVVFPKGTGASQWGHVGWVNRVEVRSDGVYISITEMNYTKFNGYNERTLKHTSGLRYIQAP